MSIIEKLTEIVGDATVAKKVPVSTDNSSIVAGSKVDVIYPKDNNKLYLGTSSFVRVTMNANVVTSLIKLEGEFLNKDYEAALNAGKSNFDGMSEFEGTAPYGNSGKETLDFYQEKLRTKLNLFFLKKYSDINFFKKGDNLTERLGIVPEIEFRYLELDEDRFLATGNVTTTLNTKLEIEKRLTPPNDNSSILEFSKELLNLIYVPQELITHICTYLIDFLKNDDLGKQVASYEYLTHDGFNPKDSLEYCKYIFDGATDDAAVSSKIDAITKDKALVHLMNFILPTVKMEKFNGVDFDDNKGFYTLTENRAIVKLPEITQRDSIQEENANFNFSSKKVVLFLSSYFSGSLTLSKVIDYILDNNPFQTNTMGNYVEFKDKNSELRFLSAEKSIFDRSDEEIGIFGRKLEGSKIVVSLVNKSEIEEVPFPSIGMPTLSEKESQVRKSRSILYDSNPNQELSELQALRLFTSLHSSDNYAYENGSLFSRDNEISSSYKFSETDNTSLLGGVKAQKGIVGNVVFSDTKVDEHHIIDMGGGTNVEQSGGKIYVKNKASDFLEFLSYYDTINSTEGNKAFEVASKVYFVDNYGQYYPIIFNTDFNITNIMRFKIKSPRINSVAITTGPDSFIVTITGDELDSSIAVHFGNGLSLSPSNTVTFDASSKQLKVTVSESFSNFAGISGEINGTFVVSASCKKTNLGIFSDQSFETNKIKIVVTESSGVISTQENLDLLQGDLTLNDTLKGGKIGIQQISSGVGSGYSYLSWNVDSRKISSVVGRLYCHMLLESTEDVFSNDKLKMLSIEKYNDEYYQLLNFTQLVYSDDSHALYLDKDKIKLDFFKILNQFKIDELQSEVIKSARIVFSYSKELTYDKNDDLLSFDTIDNPFRAPPYINIFNSEGHSNTGVSIDKSISDLLGDSFNNVSGIQTRSQLTKRKGKDALFGAYFESSPIVPTSKYKLYVNNIEVTPEHLYRSEDKELCFITFKLKSSQDNKGKFNLKVDFKHKNQSSSSSKMMSVYAIVNENPIENGVISRDIDAYVEVSGIGSEEKELPVGGGVEFNAALSLTARVPDGSAPYTDGTIYPAVYTFGKGGVAKSGYETIDGLTREEEIALEKSRDANSESGDDIAGALNSFRALLVKAENDKKEAASRAINALIAASVKYFDPDCGVFNLSPKSPMLSILKHFNETGKDLRQEPSSIIRSVINSNSAGESVSNIKSGTSELDIFIQNIPNSDDFIIISNGLISDDSTVIESSSLDIVSFEAGSGDTFGTITVNVDDPDANLSINGVALPFQTVSDGIMSLTLTNQAAEEIFKINGFENIFKKRTDIPVGWETIGDGVVAEFQPIFGPDRTITRQEQWNKLNVEVNLTPEPISVAGDNLKPERSKCGDSSNDKGREWGEKLEKRFEGAIDFVGTKLKGGMDKLSKLRSFCDFSYSLTAEFKLQLNGFEKVLTVIKVVFCIIDVLCSLTNPGKMRLSIIRLFECLWDLILMLPQIAVPVMILSLLNHLLELLECIFEKLLYYANAIEETWLALERAYEDRDLEAIANLEQVLEKHLISIEHTIDVLDPIMDIISIFRKFLDLVFNIPCQVTEEEDSIFCIEDQLASSIIFEKSQSPSNLLMFAQTYSTDISGGPCGNTPNLSSSELLSSENKKSGSTCSEEWDLSDGKVLAFSGLAKGSEVFNSGSDISSSIDFGSLRSSGFEYDGSLKASATKIIKAPIASSLSDFSFKSFKSDPKRVYISFGNRLDAFGSPKDDIDPKGLTSDKAFKPFFRNFVGAKNISINDNLDEPISLLHSGGEKVSIHNSESEFGFYTMFDNNIITLEGSKEEGMHPRSLTLNLDGSLLSMSAVPSFFIVDGDGEVYAIEDNGIRFDEEGRVKGIFSRIISNDKASKKSFDKEDQVSIVNKNIIDEQSNIDALSPLFVDAGLTYSNNNYGRKTSETQNYAEFIKQATGTALSVNSIRELMVNPDAGAYEYINGTSSEVEEYQESVGISEVYKFIDIFFVDSRSAQDEILQMCNSQMQTPDNNGFATTEDISEVNDSSEDCVGSIITFIKDGVNKVRLNMESGSIKGPSGFISNRDLYKKYTESAECIGDNINKICSMVISPVATEFQLLNDVDLDKREDVIVPDDYDVDISSAFDGYGPSFTGAENYANGKGDNVSVLIPGQATVEIVPRDFNDKIIDSDFSDRIKIKIEEDTTGSVVISDIFKGEDGEGYYANVTAEKAGVVQLSCSICSKQITAFTLDGVVNEFQGEEECLGQAESLALGLTNNLIKTTKRVIKIEFLDSNINFNSNIEIVEGGSQGRTLLPNLNYGD